VCLRRSPTLTPVFLAANRRNAQKCTGPCTPCGQGPLIAQCLEAWPIRPDESMSRKAKNLSQRRRGSKPSIASKGGGISILCALATLRETVFHFLAERGTNPTFLRNETGMSFRIRVGGILSFFVLFFTGTKLECLLESIKARGTNPISKPNFACFSCKWALAGGEEMPRIRGDVVTCEIRVFPSSVIPAKAGIHFARRWKCAADGLVSRWCLPRGFPLSRE
jgi:hypothetical protein